MQTQLREEAEAHAAQLLELERQNATDRKHWKLEKAHALSERDGFCGQVLLPCCSFSGSVSNHWPL